MRVYLVAIVLTMSPWSAFAVDGTDLPGHDYADFAAPSAFVCRTTCGGESRCQAYTWVKPGIQGPSGHCWLKHTLPNIVKNACCDSGPRNFITQRDLRAEDKIDRPGSDFKNFNTDSWKTCEAACAENGTCASWTCPCGRSRAERPLLVEEPRRSSGAKLEYGFRRKVQAGVRADRLVRLVPSADEAVVAAWT
jgi:PAN domain